MGIEFTQIDETEWIDEQGRRWFTFEIGDMRSKARYAKRQMASAVSRGLDDFDNASVYSENLEILAEVEEDLEILEALS